MGQPQYAGAFQAGSDVFITSLLLVFRSVVREIIIPLNRYGEAPIRKQAPLPCPRRCQPDRQRRKRRDDPPLCIWNVSRTPSSGWPTPHRPWCLPARTAKGEDAQV